MADYIEGKRPIIEAIRSEMPIKEILMADNLTRDGLVEDILRKAKQKNIPVKTVRKRDLDSKSERGSHQGLIAHTLPFNYVNVQYILDAAAKKAANGAAIDNAEDILSNTTKPESSIIIILDHITDAGNLGAIARSAEVIGASGIVIPNKRSARVTAATYKSSAGAISHIPLAQVANISQTMVRLKDEGYWVCGASEHASEVIWDSNLKGKIALVMGNESEGLARLTQENCDFLTKLPIDGKTSSLNVAQAASACMYEWMRQNRA